DERLVAGLEGRGLDILAIGTRAIGIELARQAGRVFGIVVQELAEPDAILEALAFYGGRKIDELTIFGQPPLADRVEAFQGKPDRIAVCVARSAGRRRRV